MIKIKWKIMFWLRKYRKKKNKWKKILFYNLYETTHFSRATRSLGPTNYNFYFL